MRREEYIQILDGTHSGHGRTVALLHQGLIVASALAISLETISSLPLWAKKGLIGFEVFVVGAFIVEYVFRVVCAPKPLRYIFSFWGIVDLVSCLPVLAIVQSQWAAVRSLRLLRLVRLLKLMHANQALKRLEAAFEQSRGELLIFAFLAAIVLYIAGVGIFIFEHDAQPEVFSSIPKSLWWAIVSFTTVGYGDMYPITPGGRLFTTGILFVGLGVIAVPTAIITTALINTDLRESLEKEIEVDLEDLEKEVRKDLDIRNRRPTRRP